MMTTCTVEKFGLKFNLDVEYEPAVAPINHPSSAGEPGEPATATVVRIVLCPPHIDRDDGEYYQDLTAMIEGLGCLSEFDAMALESLA